MVDHTKTILNCIKAERDWQIEKWGLETDDTLNTPHMWLTWIQSYGTTWLNGSHTISREMTTDFQDSMIKVAAIALAAAESVQRQRTENGHCFWEPPYSD